MSKPLILHFVDAATDFEKLPETRAEVVFIGRSNVGKSSLLNAIGGKKNLAPVSQKPRRTKALGCFALDQTGILKNAEMLGHGGFGNFETLRDFAGGQFRLRQIGQNLAAHLRRQGFKHGLHQRISIMRRSYRDLRNKLND